MVTGHAFSLYIANKVRFPSFLYCAIAIKITGDRSGNYKLYDKTKMSTDLALMYHHPSRQESSRIDLTPLQNIP